MAPNTIGRYEIVRELGRGAMGVVYEARDPNIGRTVALKTIRVDLSGSPAWEDVLRRFKNEARAAGNLNHPNIVTIFDAGEFEGMFFIALELIEGSTLQNLLIQKGRVPAEKVIDITRQVCTGLDFAHSRGIIHRDIKPGNVMLAAHGLVKITDFGIANIGDGMTMTGQVVGTPNYMSPEQVLGKPLDGRSDLFSVGVMLYEMVTGERPFEGQNITTIMYKIVHETPIPPRKLDVTIHPGLSAVIEKSLEKAPEARYQTGAELAAALQTYAATLPTANIAAGAVLPDRDRTGSMGAPSFAPSVPATVRRRRWPVITLIVLCAIAIAAFILRPHPGTKQAEPESGTPSQAVAPEPPAKPSPPPAAQSAAGTTPASEARVEPKRVNPVGSKATLKLNSSPPGAEIWIDGRPTGQRTPANVQLDRGEHEFSVRMQGFQQSGAKLRVNGGEEFEFAPQLSPVLPGIGHMPAIEVPTIDMRGMDKIPGLSEQQKREIEQLQRFGEAARSREPGILVTTQPRGARIFVDGRDTGQTTPAVITVKPGTYRVRLERDGFAPSEEEVTVQEQRQGIVNRRLKPSAPAAPSADQTLH